MSLAYILPRTASLLLLQMMRRAGGRKASTILVASHGKWVLKPASGRCLLPLLILLFSWSSRGSRVLLVPAGLGMLAGKAGRHARTLSAAAGIPVGTVAPCVF